MIHIGHLVIRLNLVHIYMSLYLDCMFALPHIFDDIDLKSSGNLGDIGKFL